MTTRLAEGEAPLSFVSVVVPAFNEVKSIAVTLREMVEVLRTEAIPLRNHRGG